MHDNDYFARFVTEIKADVNAKKHQRSAELIKTCGLHSCWINCGLNCVIQGTVGS